MTQPVSEVRERLVEVQAEDGLSLTGVEIMPAAPAGASLLWVHGFGVAYDLPQCVRLGRELAGLGIAFVAGNLRGHLGGVSGRRLRAGRSELVRIGSWWEVFEESALDIAAWSSHLLSLGRPPAVLAGHSFGALKSVFYLSEASDHRFAGLVLASPSFGLRRLEADLARRALEMVEEGRGEELLPGGSWPTGFGTTTVSAQTYASWWRVAPGLLDAPDTRFAAIDRPLLVFYGTSGDVGGGPELDLISGLATAAPRIDRKLLPGVSHGYAGGEAAIAALVAGWIETAVAPTSPVLVD